MSHIIIGKTKALLFLILAGLSFSACTDTIADEKRFTFTGEQISDHLEKNPERFSKFTEILKKARLGDKSSASIMKTLSTYGSYTCFAPTNEAIDAFLEEQYNRHLASIEENKQNSNIPIYDLVTSPELEDLSVETATLIAKNHVVEMGYNTIVIGEGATLPMPTMSNRTITVEFKDENGRVYAILNNSSRIIDPDLEMENGYIHVVDAVIHPSDKLIFEHLKKLNAFKLFTNAIEITGIDSILNIYDIDPDYDPLATPETLTSEGKDCPYPKDKKQLYTILAVPDQLFVSLGYPTIDDIIELANKWYNHDKDGNPLSPEILNNFRHKENPLYKFVAYHIIDRQLSYSSGTGPGGFIMQNYVVDGGFNSKVNLNQNFDSYDYFETLLPYAMIKVTKPYTNPELRQHIVINYGKDRSNEMSKHINVIVDNLTATKNKYKELQDFEQTALNGIIHTIDRILIYNEDEMAGNVLRERMRIDLSSIMPELTNNNVRWALSTGNEPATFIPGDYSKSLRVNNEDCKIFYLRPHKTWLDNYSMYMGDELLVEGKYDFEYRIPHVPPGTYELRFGYGKGIYRGVCQFYFNNKIAGIPVDLRWTEETKALIGWERPEQPMTPEEEKAKDKDMRNRGYMRGPGSIVLEEGNSQGSTMRDSNQALRKIIGTFKFERNTDYWLRFKDVSDEGSTSQFEQDYLEIVPLSVINDALNPEDIY